MRTNIPKRAAANRVDRWLLAAAKFIDSNYWIVFALQLALWSYALMLVFGVQHLAFADPVRLPGEDISAQMESAGTLLRFVDTALFGWVARVLCGLCVAGAAWSLKEARFGSAVIAIISALLFGTAPTWVKDIFTIGGTNSVFSQSLPVTPAYRVALLTEQEGERRG